jgi:hypothetical protein
MSDLVTSSLFILWAASCPLIASRLTRRPLVAAGVTTLSGGVVLVVLHMLGYGAIEAAGWSVYVGMVICVALITAWAVHRRSATAG